MPSEEDFEDFEEFDTAYCPDCEEEYRLPESAMKCPFCGSTDLDFT